MLAKLNFALLNYAVLVAVLAACWGVGRLALRGANTAPVAGMLHPLATTLGLGVGICALQALAVAGLLNRSAVLACLAIGLVLAALQWRSGRDVAPRPSAGGASPTWTAPARCVAMVVAVLLLGTALAPLRPPMEWDELAYHLPHARQWALHGQLVVTPWLRYPWFPYNFDLLFSGALLFDNDVLPHLLHASTGWLVAWLVLRLGLRHFTPLTACVATGIWLILSRDDYSRAYVDMGVTLFVLAGCIAFDAWRQTGSRRWLVVAAFALGVAAGAKYQVLAFLPLFAIVLAWRERRVSAWLLATAALLLPCIYWYARNALLTGDPFNPVGGKLFGFSDWNLGDYAGQFDDLRSHVGLPHWLLWAAPLAALWPTQRRSAWVRGAAIFSAWALLAWAASSRYPRYLMPAFPLLGLLSAAGWVWLATRLRWRPAGAWRDRAAVWTPRLLAGLAVVVAALVVVRGARNIAPDPAQRDALLRSRIPGYSLLRQLDAQPQGRIYQIGLEGAIYYAPNPIWGDWFGPWRYRDFLGLEPAALHAALARQDFDTLLIDTSRFPDVVARPGFDRYFKKVQGDQSVLLYRLQPP